MEKQNQIFDLGEQNILEEFYELVEKHRLSSNEFQLGDFYDALNNFDLAYQNYNTENNAKSISDCRSFTYDLGRHRPY
jgi:hypothetical protein